MTGLGALIKRNCKLFFRDKGMFFTSLITPLILLVLYATFLARVYRNSFASALPAGFSVEDALLSGTVGGQLVSSLLAVCCVTVAFCSNLLMVQDKTSGARRDLTMSPVKRSTLALGYFAASALVTLIICFAALGVCLIYLYVVGWYLTVADVLLLCLDILCKFLFHIQRSSFSFSVFVWLSLWGSGARSFASTDVRSDFAVTAGRVSCSGSAASIIASIGVLSSMFSSILSSARRADFSFSSCSCGNGFPSSAFAFSICA